MNDIFSVRLLLRILSSIQPRMSSSLSLSHLFFLFSRSICSAIYKYIKNYILMAARALLPRLQDFEVYYIIHHPDCLLLTPVWFPSYLYHYISQPDFLGNISSFHFLFFIIIHHYILCLYFYSKNKTKQNGFSLFRLWSVSLTMFHIISDTVLRMPSLISKPQKELIHQQHKHIYIYPSFGCSVDVSVFGVALHLTPLTKWQKDYKIVWFPHFSYTHA